MLPSDEILPEMKRRLKDVVDVLGIPASAAAVLLREHKWSKDVLFEKFFVDPEKLSKKYGVFFRLNPKVCPSATKSSFLDMTCNICYEGNEKLMGMPCGHEFCTGCWGDFARNAVEEGPACIRKTCPEAKCTEVMTEEEVQIAAEDCLAKFESYQLRSFVESNSLTRWCPGRGCERVACATSASAMEQEGSVAHCDSCLTSFCLCCGEEPHSPSNCKELAKWNEKCRNESETANWILANTKSCPKCSSRIEKNQGCNHMSCQKCRFEFCWICMGDWNDHGANT